MKVLESKHSNPLQHAASKMLAKLDEIDPTDIASVNFSVVMATDPDDIKNEPETKAEAKKEEATGKEPNGKPEGDYNGAEDEGDEPKAKAGG